MQMLYWKLRGAVMRRFHSYWSDGQELARQGMSYFQGLCPSRHRLPLLFAVMVRGPQPWDTDRARRNWLCFCLWLLLRSLPLKGGLVFI